MHSGQRHGFDYTPLFRFLLSKVGENWADVHSEAVARLDREEPIAWMVAASYSEGSPFFQAGESSYFSGLYVDEHNILAVVDPGLTADTMRPFLSLLYPHSERTTPYDTLLGKSQTGYLGT